MKSGFTNQQTLFAPLLLALSTAGLAACIVAPATGSSSTSAGAGAGPSSGETSTTGGGVVVPPGPDPNQQADSFPYFPASKTCEKCHGGLYGDWVNSMHAHAITSPISVAEFNELYQVELFKLDSPDPQQICVNCHAPITTSFVRQATLPFSNPKYPVAAQTEGIGCLSCHAYTGKPKVAFAGDSHYQNFYDTSGTYLGPFNDPAVTGAHKSTGSMLMNDTDGKASAASETCISCHNVNLDRNGDKKIEFGVDLILQNTTAEFLVYQQQNGEETCVTCHMPIKSGVDRAADTAKVGTSDQQNQAPLRQVRSHAFAGVDYPLDTIAKDGDPQKSLREDLLKSGVNFEVTQPVFNGDQLQFNTKITNVKTGHNFPTGFAFARQTWIEVVIRDDVTKTILAQSGRLVSPTDDLCDASTFNDVLVGFMNGCQAADPQLVNLQLQLIDQIAPGQLNGVAIAVRGGDARETIIQNLAGGPVARVRPIDKQIVGPIPPNKTASFDYSFPVAKSQNTISATVSLLFRNLPPYFVRAMAAKAPAMDQTLTPHIKDIQIVKIDSKNFTIMP